MIFEMNVFFLSRYIVKLDYIESTVKDYFFCFTNSRAQINFNFNLKKCKNGASYIIHSGHINETMIRQKNVIDKPIT